MKKIILWLVRQILSKCLKFKIILCTKNISLENRKKILLINLHGIGDLVMATPAIELLKINYPYSEIDLLVSAPAAILFKDDPRITHICEFINKKPLTSIRNITEKYDTVILFIGGIWGTIAALSIKSKEIMGMALNTTLAAVWKDENNKIVVRRFNEKTHLSNLMINAIKPIIKTENKDINEYKLYINYNNINIEKFNLKKPYIVIAPETNWDIKEIKEHLIIELIAYYKERNISAVIIGQRKKNISEINDLRGKTTLLEAAKIIKNSEYVISADSAFMHISSALGKPVFSIFGPTDPERLAPFGKSIIFRKNIYCSPCYKEIYIPKCLNLEYNLCMKWSLNDLKKELELFEEKQVQQNGQN